MATAVRRPAKPQPRAVQRGPVRRASPLRLVLRRAFGVALEVDPRAAGTGGELVLDDDVVLAGLIVLFSDVALALRHRRLFVAELRPVLVPPGHQLLEHARRLHPFGPAGVGDMTSAARARPTE